MSTDGPPAGSASTRPNRYEEPTLGQVMRRPQWILALLLAIAIAGAFAWLGRWQMDQAFRDDSGHEYTSEEVRPLGSLTGAWQPVSEDVGGMMVSLEGALVPGDFLVVERRTNQGEMGAWVVGHLAVTGDGAASGNAGDGPASLAVALGWAPSATAAATAAQRLEAAFAEPRPAAPLEGRYMPPDGIETPKPDQRADAILSMAPAQLANLWQRVDGPVYAGYLVLHTETSAGVLGAADLDAAGLDPVDSVPPIPPETVNWLNLFYAIEWIVFAGFAGFLWYRLTRDAWEKEHEIKRLEADAAARSAAAPPAEPEPTERPAS